jgi:predicted nucleic acid-binding protein
VPAGDAFAGVGTSAIQYARLFHQLRRQRTPIPTSDIWIAALVVQHQLYLFERDAYFDHLPQIPKL